MTMDRLDLVKQIKQFLQTESAFGLTEIPKVSGARDVKLSTYAPCPPSPNRKTQLLEDLKKEFQTCACCALSAARTRLVFGSGSADARLMFVGEAPGRDEDLQGEPFVGAAGQLLTKIIVAMKLKREEVYIANCLKCRPPDNRNPLPAEIAACRPILMRQIEIIKPQIICTLGKFATWALLQTTEPISRLRGRFFDWNGARLMPTFHPAYLLRNPADKKLVWLDAQRIMKALGINV
ncbi:MAG: hypothetical protein AUJ71_02825 [Candidatus Omnitrophica bacterium CG1_02_49_16]|nr:MAG: hypothetical protein AUJ71_02825 [Candidatus Omnitrophica bacterium CG1_02_49_16]